MKRIEIGPAISYGWESVKKNFWYFVAIAAIYMAVSSIPGADKNDNGTLSLLGIIISAYFTAGMLKLTLSYFDKKMLPLSDLFTQVKYFWRILGATILIMLIVVAGFILLIVPGIIWALRYQFVLNLIVDKDMGISEAMHKSDELTKGVKLQLLVFNLSIVGITLLGFLALGIGIFVTLPIGWLAEIKIYRALLKATEKEDKPEKEAKEEKE